MAAQKARRGVVAHEVPAIPIGDAASPAAQCLLLDKADIDQPLVTKRD
jgi:hypothetical protein